MRLNSLASILLASILALGVVAAVPAFAHQEHTDFVTNAEYIRGHLEQAIANKQAGNNELAIAHAGHPIHEVFTLMEGPLAEVSQQRADDLREALEALPNSVQSDSVQAFTQKVTDINDMLDEAVVVYAGEEAEALTTKAGVITGLLETAGLEYGEAVENGEIIEMIEYQDASAFISRAELSACCALSACPPRPLRIITERVMPAWPSLSRALRLDSKVSPLLTRASTSSSPDSQPT